MSEKVRTRFKADPSIRHHFIKEWRLHRGLTQEQLAERMHRSTGWVSQIESGTIGYTQDTLEALANALITEPASLIMRDPTASESIWSIWETLKPEDRARAVIMLDALRKAS